MQTLAHILPWIQISISVLLIIVVLFQASSAGLGGALSGSDSLAHFHTRRGFEKFLFVSTFIFGALLVVSAVIRILL